MNNNLFLDPYNPYCSKWGYCTWTPQFGDEGPPQSKGAVEDGVRGQCRDDKDCTPWAPSCSPLGYCRGGVQVLSFENGKSKKVLAYIVRWHRFMVIKFDSFLGGILTLSLYL